jgi:hypothetical protein
MSRLVRLYPQAWRARYEAEFLALLQERPPTTSDVVDTVRGALDAHLHPHLAGGDIKPSPWTHRIPGLLALAGGLIYSAGLLGAAFWAAPASAYESLIGWSLVLMFLSLPGDYMAAHGRRIAIVLGLLGLVVLAVNIAGWSVVSLVLGVGGLVAAFGGLLVMAAIRAEVGPNRRWFLLVSVVLVPIAVPTAISLLREAAALGPLDFGPWSAVAILLPYGLVWSLIGLRMTIRGAPTIVDLPISTIEAEARPA